MANMNSFAQQHARQIEKISTEFNATIIEDEHFKNIQTGPEYWVTFYMINERILFTFPYGDSSKLDMRSYYEKRTEFINLYGPKDGKIIEIRNYADIHGFPDKQSRLIQTENLLKDNDRLLAFIILSAPIYVKMVFKVGLKVTKTAFPVYFYNNYSSAINKANNIINQKIRRLLSSAMLKQMTDYKLSMPNFEAEFSLIPNILLYVNAKGSPTVSEAETFCNTEKAIYTRHFNNSIPIYRIINYSKMNISGLNQRLIYAKHLRKIYKKGKLVKATIVVGATPLIKNAIAMLKKLFSINTIFVKSLDEAFNKINLIESQETYTNLTDDEDLNQINEHYFRSEVDLKINALLEYMGSLTWGKIKDTAIEIDNNDFLKPVYEALRVIENDVNNMLEERADVQKKLQLANRKLGLDIKARVRYEEERKNLEEQLHQSEKMQAIGQLAGGIAHDFNNQLAAIVGYTDLLKRNMPTDPKLQKYTDNIKLVTNRAKDLTSQLLAFARKGKYHSTDVNMHELILEVSNLSKHTMDKKIIINQELFATNPTVEGDPTQLQNALLNLSINARDAMPDGGTITFKTENISSSSEWFRERGVILGPGNYLKLSVNDTGAGIPSGIINHIFEPFFTTKKQGQGTGMGLAAVYGTIKNHHGTIELDTTPGKGTTFHILMPQNNLLIEKQSKKENEESKNTSSGFGDTIFLIDDEEAILETTTELMQELGYTVFESKNPVDAIKLYSKAYDKIDVVLLDMIMPEMGGAEVYAKLKEINENIKVIVTSGYSIEHEQRLINDENNVYFIQKPYEITDLDMLVKDILHKEKDG